MLRRAPSFSRQRKAPKLPAQLPSSTLRTQKDEPTYTYTDSEVKVCKVLRGWLKKRHSSAKSIGPRWGQRYVWVDEHERTLCYSKSQADGAAARSCVHLSDVMAVFGSEGRPELPAHCIVLRCGKIAGAFEPNEQEFIFGAEDKEEAQMWIAQVRRPAAATAPTPARWPNTL